MNDAKELAQALINSDVDYRILLDHNLGGNYGGDDYKSVNFLTEIGVMPEHLGHLSNVVPFTHDIIDMELDWSRKSFQLNLGGFARKDFFVFKGDVSSIEDMFKKIRLVTPENGEGDNISLA